MTRQHSNRGNRAMTTETTWIRAGHEDVLALVPGLWFPVAEQPGGNIVAFVKTGENRDCIIADHNAALVSPAGVDLALVRSTLESKIKDDRYHPQYILGMAFAHQLLESVPAAEANWRDWKKLLAAERANVAEAVRQRDETNTQLSESLWRENALRDHLADALAVRDDNEAVAVERLARLALVEADAEALADALDDMLSYTLSNRGGKYEFVTCRSDADTHALELDAGRAALAAHEALKSK